MTIPTRRVSLLRLIVKLAFILPVEWPLLYASIHGNTEGFASARVLFRYIGVGWIMVAAIASAVTLLSGLYWRKARIVGALMHTLLASSVAVASYPRSPATGSIYIGMAILGIMLIAEGTRAD